MATAYQVSAEYLNYTHGETIVQCTSLDEATKWYLDTIQECINDGESNSTDYVLLESIDAELDEDGEVKEINEYHETLKEHVFKEFNPDI